MIACLAFQADAQQRVRMETTLGTIDFILYDETPKHKSNFMRLISEGYFDGLLFHRVIPRFMIQAGDPESREATSTRGLGNGGPGYTIPAEINNKFIHKKGALAAARQPDAGNPEFRSNGSQFYFVQGSVYLRNALQRYEKKNNIIYTEKQKIDYETLGGMPHLDGKYTIFGQIIWGLDVLEKISQVKTGRGDRPVEDVRIISVKLIK